MRVNVQQNQLKKHVDSWCNCTQCPIGKIARNHVFFRIENPGQKVNVLFIGEAPGVMEDIKGLPFVGKSGMLLNDLIKEAEPGDLNYGFTNTVACRPTDRLGGANRQPTAGETLKCSKRLEEFIQILQPQVIVLVGSIARETAGFSARDAGFNGYITNIVHPAYLLRTGCTAEKMQQTVRKIKDAFENARYILSEDQN